MKDSKDKPQIDEIGCLEAINGLYAYLDGEMNDPESIAKFEHHLEHCQACYSRTELESALGELIRKSAKGKAPEKLQNRLRKLIDGI
jgi:anti-sigma factor (TIGR02949 family)